MEEHGADLTGIAIVMAGAVASGLMLQRLRQPAVVGYILAGVILGPSGVGLVARSEQVTSLAELGVILLLFLIGMELSLRAFMRVLRPAALTAMGQIGVSLLIAALFGAWLDWAPQQSILIGFIIAMSSTALAIKMLEDVGELRSDTGRITIGVLIAQDIAVVPILIVVSLLGSGRSIDAAAVIRIVVAIGVLAAFVRVLSRRGKIALPFTHYVSGRVDLLTLAALALCFVAASISGVLGLTPAYGAFLAGLLVANSTLRAEAIQVTEPIQSVLVVVFFLSIGLLIDLAFLWDNIGLVLLFVIGTIAIKTVLNVWLLHLAGEPWERAFPAGLIMAQIGEFSFILAAAGLSNRVLSWDGYRLAICVIAVSLLISPMWMNAVRRFQAVAAGGITDFRSAMGEVYAEELSEIERSRLAAVRIAQAARQRAKALRLAVQRRRKGRETTEPAPAAEPSPPAGPTSPERAERNDPP
ncbi:MAG: cation:proton antiporter [Rhodospirillales bacterium]